MHGQPHISSTSTPFVQFHVRAVFVAMTVFIQLFPRNSSVSVLVEIIDKLKKNIKSFYNAHVGCI